MCRTSPAEKGRYIKIILSLLQSQFTAVVYECACTLTALSQAPTAIRAAAACFCQLLVSQSDNNVKLIILDRLTELKGKHKDVMQVRRARLAWVHEHSHRWVAPSPNGSLVAHLGHITGNVAIEATMFMQKSIFGKPAVDCLPWTAVVIIANVRA